MTAITKQTTSTYALKSSFKKPVRTLVCGFAPSPDLEDIVEKDETPAPSEPVANGKLETFPDDLVYCKRVIKGARPALAQRILNKGIRKGDDVIARGATHTKMTLISLEDAQKSREIADCLPFGRALDRWGSVWPGLQDGLDLAQGCPATG